MRGRLDPHARYRELLAARLDRPLTRAEQRGLVAHVRACTSCQQAERDYRDESRQLRSLSAPMPPRDMWARTSTALDREVTRWPFRPYRYAGRFGRGSRSVRSGTSGATATVLAAIGVVSVLTVMQLSPGRPAPPNGPVNPTPFLVQGQALAFIGSDAADFSIYQTNVRQVCPPTAPDCFEPEGFIRTRVDLSSRVKPRTMAVNPNGNRVAIVGDEVDQAQDFIGVVVLPDQQPGSHGQQPSSGHGPAATIAARSTDKPTATGSRQPTGPDNSPDTGSPGPDATDGRASADPLTGTPPPDAATPPDGGMPPDTTPPPSVVPGLTVLAIIENVTSAGAPPAWSVDGDVLAFSAMPSDGSLGPDVYVWQPGDSQARAITTDHSSFFASWSGRRVVASRIKGLGDLGTRGPVEVATVVIDPTSLEERRVDGPQMWLPVVDPDRSNAVVWYGTLEHDGLSPAPRTGALYLVDWTSLDPYGPSAQEPQASPPDEGPTSPPAQTAGPDATQRPAGPDFSPGAGTLTSDTDKLQRPDQAANPADAAAPDSTVVPNILSPIDPSRDPVAEPVLDWQARWSTDGRVLGVWFADVQNANWGQLELLAVEPGAHKVGSESVFMGPLLAKRGFTLGLSRVAFVAATDDPAGELRVRTWDSAGGGGTWQQSLQIEEVLPGF